MVDVIFDPDAFRVAYPPFASGAEFPNALLQGYFDTSAVFMGKRLGVNCFVNNDRLVLALNLMTAHFAEIGNQIKQGNSPGIVTNATVDKVSVTLEPPPLENQFAWWCNQTPYGAQLYALLSVASVGGTYVGARPELAAFRRGGGL